MKPLLVVLAQLIASSTSFALTLDAALSQTLEKNPAIQQARAEVEAAAGRKVILRAIAWPDLRFDIFGGDQGGHRAGQPANQPFGFARGFFMQPLVNAAVPASFRRGNIELLIAQQRLNVAIVEQLHGTRVAFCTALYNRSVADFGTAQSERLTANVASETERYQGGQSRRSAMTAAQSLVRELGPRIESAQRDYNGAVLALVQATGSGAGRDAVLPVPEGRLHLHDRKFDFGAESERAIAQRADLQLARLMVRAAAEDQRIIEAAYYPAINGVVSGNYIPVSDVRRDSGGSPQRANDVISSEVRAGAAFTWRVIDNGKTGGAVMRQRAVREMNELVLHRLESNVPRELERIGNTLRGIEARQKALAGASAAAEQNVTAAHQNLAQGLASQLEVRSAETTALEMQTALLTAAFEQNIALSEWDRATGRYFQFSDDTPANRH